MWLLHVPSALAGVFLSALISLEWKGIAVGLRIIWPPLALSGRIEWLGLEG
jgi:hypothetical protein